MYELKPDSCTQWDGTYEFTSFNGIYKLGDRIDNVNEPGETLTLTKVPGPAVNAYEYSLTVKTSPEPVQSVGMAYTDCTGTQILKLLSQHASLELVSKQNDYNKPIKGKLTGTVQYANIGSQQIPITGLIYGSFVRKESR